MTGGFPMPKSCNTLSITAVLLIRQILLPSIRYFKHHPSSMKQEKMTFHSSGLPRPILTDHSLKITPHMFHLAGQLVKCEVRSWMSMEPEPSAATRKPDHQILGMALRVMPGEYETLSGASGVVRLPFAATHLSGTEVNILTPSG